MTTFKEFLDEKIDRPVGDDPDYDFVVIRAKVVPKGKAHGKGPPMVVTQIIDDQQVMVRDAEGKSHKMMIRDLAPWMWK